MKPAYVAALDGLRNEVTAPVAPPQSSTADEIARLRAELDTLKRAQASGCSCRVSQNGAVSLYGLGRFPVTLYANQWQRLFEAVEVIKAFIASHTTELASKGG